MGTFGVYTSRDPQLLLEHAAAGFLAPARNGCAFPSPDHYLVLRQGGLRDDLLALAARNRVPGWFDPPIAVFQELPDLLAELPRAAIGEFERVVLAARALRDTRGEVFGRIRDADAYAGAADRWFGELIAEGITPAGLAAALERAGARDGFAARRDGELQRAYARYLELLGEAELRDPRARLLDCAAAVRADATAVRERLGGRRALRLVGLSDPRGGWPELLQALKECTALDRIAVYASDRLPFLEQLADEVIDLDAERHFSCALLAGEASVTGTRPAIDLVSAPDLPREVEEVAARVRRLVERGVPPHRIAVVARSARPYAQHLLRALERVGVPATSRRRYALAEVPALRALLALFHVAAEGWERHGLVELAETPYFRARLDAGVLNHIGYQRRVQGLEQWGTALRELATRAARREQLLRDDPDDEDARRQSLPAFERVEQATSRFAEFAALASALAEPRTVAAWLDWLTKFLEDDPWYLERTIFRAPGGRFETVRLDTVAWRAMRDIVAEWRRAESHWGGDGAIDVAAFHARLRAMLSGDAALFTPVRRGVQVLEGLAAAFRSFEHVFLVGLDSARVPLRAPRSPLLDEQERLGLRAAGLPIDTHAQWDEREQALFRNLLACAATSLTLSYARYDDSGAEQLPSAFLEEIGYALGVQAYEIAGSRAFTPGVPLARDGAAVELALLAARAERARRDDAPSPFNGAIEATAMLQWLGTELGEARIWSPTQIEAYAKCPWAYFSARLLRLEKFEDPDLDIDPRTRGTILHDALRRFYAAAAQHTQPPIYLRTADLEWAVPLAEQAAADAIEHARASLWVGHPALEKQKLNELKRQLVAYVEWEAEDNDAAYDPRKRSLYPLVRTGVVDHELSFDEIVLEVDGTRVRYRGFIDRVERGMDERGGSERLYAAVDYKTTIYSTPASGKNAGWEDGVVLQVPLYAHALTQLHPGSRAARVEYRSVKRPTRVHALPLYRYEKNGRLTEDPTVRDRYDAALRDVAKHVRAARTGVFPPQPPPSCNCPPFCHGRDICRIPGGPRE